MAERDSSHDSGSGRRKRFAGDRLAIWWDPRRSLGARLAFFLLPFLLVPVVFYWYASDLVWRHTRDEIAATVTQHTTARERGNLRNAADRRARELDEEAAEVISVAREASADVLRALSEVPGAGGAAEPLEDVPGGPIRTKGPGPSAAVISRLAGVVPASLRDLAATRRLEPRFGSLLVGHPGISRIYVFTATGVLRAFPWSDLERLVASGGLDTAFKVPGRTPLGAPGSVTWTPVYEDRIAGRGRILSALVPVYDDSGRLLGEVGVDWLLSDLFSRFPEVRPGRELVFTREGRLLHEVPSMAPAIGPRDLASLRAGPSGEREVEIGGEAFLASARRVPASEWTYVRLLPVSALRQVVRQQLDSVFTATRRTRVLLQAATLFMILLVGGPLVAAARRATAPIRGLARYSDAITRREEPGKPPGTGRRDEVGRLARALEELEGRVRRRMHSMEGLHDLARTGAVMTRPDETFARLTRRIAELVGATKAWFALWDAEARELVFTPPGYGIASERLSATRIPDDRQSLAMLAFRTGETYVSNELTADPRVSQTIAHALEVTRNAVFVPLRTEAGTLGLLIVCDKATRFEAEDQAAIQIYADEAALLLRNARLYEELQKSFERLSDAHRNRDYFLQNINHELRTPLTAILGWSEVLAEDRPDPPTVATAVEQIRRSAQFLLTLISDLLDLSRFEEGRTQLDLATTDVGTLVREAIEPVAVMAEAKGIAIAVAAPEKGCATARLDPLRTRQVLWNLVHNAVKFTPKGGRIDVAASRDDRGVTFTVSDDGVGIDPKDLPFIFERFRQGDGSTTRAYRGTGIGLALAKAYVELHGGRIEAENRPTRGALFRVFIPDIAA